MRVSLALFLLACQLTAALVPHTYWNGKSCGFESQASGSRQKNGLASKSGQMKMYFDDCEREDNVIKPFSSSQQPQKPWIMSPSEEKQLAMDRLLGYSYQSALKLDDEQMENEILQWAIDTFVLWDGEEETRARSKYTSLSDLVVNSSCTTPEQCLASLWKTLAHLLETKEVNSVHWLVFPKCQPLWDYDTMVTLLQAIRVSKPQLGMDVAIDLFHPKYKNAPTMFSPETHSPFPTVALQIRDGRAQVLEDDDDAAQMRAKLEALFNSIDVVPENTEERRRERTPKIVSPDLVLMDCQWWFDQQQNNNDDDDKETMEWIVEPQEQPFHVYSTLWNVIPQLGGKEKASSAMVLAPSLDAHTLHRVAVTVNAALQRLDSRVRIVNVYHPSSQDDSRKSPHAMIQLEYK